VGCTDAALFGGRKTIGREEQSLGKGKKRPQQRRKDFYGDKDSLAESLSVQRGEIEVLRVNHFTARREKKSF